MSKRVFPTYLSAGAKKRKTLNNQDLVGAFDYSNTESALTHLKTLFPVQTIRHLPPVFLVHQLYSLISNKSLVDEDVNRLQSEGKLHLFEFGVEEKFVMLTFLDDFRDCARKNCSAKPVLDKFLDVILPEVQDVRIDRASLTEKYGLSGSEIEDLVDAQLLTIGSAGIHGFSFPFVNEYLQMVKKGRQSILKSIRKNKDGQVLVKVLRNNKFEKNAKLGLEYHLHDLVGSGRVTRFSTLRGTMLKFVVKE